jgi:hypothetical protein
MRGRVILWLGLLTAVAAAGCAAQDVANVLPEEGGVVGYLLRNADPLNAVFVAFLTYLIRPVFSRIPFFAIDRNRFLVIVPILLGMGLGYAIEGTSRGVQPWVVYRRGFAAGAGAVVLLWFARAFFQSANSAKRQRA